MMRCSEPVPFFKGLLELVLIQKRPAGYRAVAGVAAWTSGCSFWAIVDRSMKRISSFLLGMATGAALLHAATLYHVVRAPDGVHFIAKQPARLSETYIDIRSFTMTDWAEHPQLASALVLANQQQLIGESAAGAIQEAVNQALPAWPKN
jgi:hypothetical protein